MAIAKQEQVRHFLVVEDHQGKRRLPLEVATYSLGRAPYNSIVLHAPSISRQHAMIVRVTVSESNGYTFRIVDGNLNGKRSTNGVFVNGNRCFSHDLKDGDLIKFGDRVQAQYLVVVNQSNHIASDSDNSELDHLSEKSPSPESSSHQLNFSTTDADNCNFVSPKATVLEDNQIEALQHPSAKMGAQTGIERFLEIITHKLRTSNNAIISTTKQLLETQLSAEQKLYAQTVQTNSKTMLNTIHNLVDLAKIESGELPLEKYPFSLHQCIEQAINQLDAEAAAKDLKLNFSIDANVPTTIINDANRLQQILINLIDNGINFTHSGEINISITANQISLSQSKAKQFDRSTPIYQLHFSIQDTGIGISSELKQDLFQFNQMKTLPGTGLALSKQLIEMMQGQIWAESQGRVYGNPPVGWRSPSSWTVGSIFHFTILAQADAPTTKQLSIPNQPLSSSSKILLVEDDRVNQEVIKLILESLGYQADIVNNGLEAIKAWSHTSYDLVLMDVEMPQMDGLSATFHLRQQTLSSHYPYIIAITASTSPHSKQKCLQAGMNDYIAKPFTKNKLEQVLQRVQTQLSAVEAIHQATSNLDSKFTDEKIKSPLDYRILESIRQMGGEKANQVLRKIIRNFLQDTPKKLEAIQTAINTDNPQDLRQLAHNLKSSSANLGAVNFSSLCKQLENLGRSGTTEGASDQLNQLQIEYKQVHQALNSEYQNMAPQLTNDQIPLQT